MYRTGMPRPGTAAVEALFGPGRIGQVVTGNRFVRAGTSEGMVDHRNLANADLARLLGQLAGLGVGLIITGHVFVDRRGQYDDDQTAIDTDEAIGSADRGGGRRAPAWWQDLRAALARGQPVGGGGQSADRALCCAECDDWPGGTCRHIRGDRGRR